MFKSKYLCNTQKLLITIKTILIINISISNYRMTKIILTGKWQRTLVASGIFALSEDTTRVSFRGSRLACAQQKSDAAANACRWFRIYCSQLGFCFVVHALRISCIPAYLFLHKLIICGHVCVRVCATTLRDPECPQ